jgi:hypothetical protein
MARDYDPERVAQWRAALNDEGNELLDQIIERGDMPALGLFARYRKTQPPR